MLFSFLSWIITPVEALALPFAELNVPSAASRSLDDCEFRSGASNCNHEFCSFARPAGVEERHSWSLGFRLGEAANPGPETLLTIGCSNPSGLRTKETLALSHGPGIWSFSETQLSAYTQKTSARALRLAARADGREVRTLFGAAAPLRSRSTWAGSHTGVACVSDLRAKQLQINWPHELWTSGRIMASQHFYGRHTITVMGFRGDQLGQMPDSR